MNPDLAPLFARRSIRQFTERDVSNELVRDLLEAAMAAPSAVAKDPWHFIVARDQSLREAIAEALPNGKMIAHAPVGFVVCGDLERAHSGELSFMLQDCSAAIQNLLLAASMLGLGAVWLGVHPRQERIEYLSELFSLPAHIIPIAAIAVGWPQQSPPPRTRYRPEAVHDNAW